MSAAFFFTTNRLIFGFLAAMILLASPVALVYADSSNEQAHQQSELAHKELLAHTRMLANEALYSGRPSSKEGQQAFFLYRQYVESGSSTDLAEVHSYLEKAVAKEDAEAMALLGQLLQEGEGVEPAPKRAISLFERSTKLGSASGAYHLGLSYHNGEGVEKDPEKARHYFESAKANDFELAGLALGELDYRQGRFVTAKMIAHEYADKGYPQAYMLLGEMYTKSIGGSKPDMQRARRSFQRAKDLGWPEGAYQLYFIYNEGNGVVRDTAKAVAYLKEASDMGYADAKAELCLLYAEGYGPLDKDLQKGFQLCKESAQAGSALGASNLAGMYREDDIPQHSMEKYKYWLEVAAERGHAMAMGIISARYFRGIKGFPKDMQKGFDWAKRSAEAGWPQGMFFYAVLLGDDIVNDIPSLDGPDWNGCWYWASIKHALVPGQESRAIKELCESKSSTVYRVAKQEEIKRRIAEFQDNYWVIMYRRDVARGLRSRH